METNNHQTINQQIFLLHEQIKLVDGRVRTLEEQLNKWKGSLVVLIVLLNMLASPLISLGLRVLVK